MKEELFSFLSESKLEISIEEKEHFEKIEKELLGIIAKINDIENIRTVDAKEIILALLIASNPKKREEIKDFIDRYPDFIKANHLGSPLLATIYYLNYKEINTIISNYNNYRIIDFIDVSRKIRYACFGLDIEFSPFISFFWFLRKNYDCLSELWELFNGLTQSAYYLAINLINAKKKLNGEDEYALNALKNISAQYEDYITSKLNEMRKEYKRKERNNKRFNKNLAELISMLDTEDEIKNIDEILKRCPNDSIKEKVVDYVISHNQKIYMDLTEEYEKAKKNSDENLQRLFANFGFNYDYLNENDQMVIKEMPYEEIEDLLRRLNKLAITNINVGKVSKNKLTKIEDLLSKGFIDVSWLLKNHDLLYEHNEGLSIVESNLEELSQENINILQYQNSLDILRSINLAPNMLVIKNYALRISKGTTNITFLKASDLNKRIDFLISIGLYGELFDSLDALNNNLNDCYRLKIAKMLNIPINAIPDSEEFIYDFASSMIPENIKDALASNLAISYELPPFLNSYLLDNQVLNINGVLASVAKVKSNLGKIGSDDASSVFYAIIYEGYYTLEEIEILKNALEPSFGSRVRS